MQNEAYAELRGRKANSVIDNRLVTVKVNLGVIRPAHCSLYPLCSQEREAKLIPPFSFFIYLLFIYFSSFFFLTATPRDVDFQP